MQLSAKITSKGQITIPKQVREKPNVKQGDVVTFYPYEKMFLFGDEESIYKKN